MRALIPRPTTGRGALFELVLIVALAIGLALAVQAYAVKPYQIPSGSMEPTLDINQRVLVNRLAYRFGDPSVGDVVVFHPPAQAESADQCAGRPSPVAPCAQAGASESDTNFIKRIVAGPGDTIAVHKGHPVVNGVEAENEDFTRPCGNVAGARCNLPDEITIPPGHYFMMGDNRGRSDDSRFWGPIPRDWIIGKAIVTYWPPDRIGTL